MRLESAWRTLARFASRPNVDLRCGSTPNRPIMQSRTLESAAAEAVSQPDEEDAQEDAETDIEKDLKDLSFV